jgi:hypothetical protein
MRNSPIRSLAIWVMSLVFAAPAAAQSLSWGRQFGSAGGDTALAIAPDGAGGALVAGFTEGSLFGPFLGDWYDAFLARYDGAGSQSWGRQFGTSANDATLAIAFDGAGGAYVAGHTAGTLFGPHAGMADVFLARYDGAGNQTWGRQFGTGHNDYAEALSHDGERAPRCGGDSSGPAPWTRPKPSLPTAPGDSS